MESTNMQDLLKYLEYAKELTINPFGLGKTSCNNNCKFCIVSRRMVKGDVPLSYFQDTINNTKKWLNKYLDSFPEDIKFTFFFVAGELYYMNKEYFDLYKQTVSDLFEIVSKKYKDIKFSFQSNLFLDHEHLDYFIDLINYTKRITNNINVTTSFDLWGRFNNIDQATLWYNNLNLLQQQLNRKVIVEMILTQPTILCYLNEDNVQLNTYLNEILGKPHLFDVAFEDYVLNSLDNKDLYPNTIDLVSFYKKVYERFPNHPVLSFYTQKTANKYCNSKPRNECILIQFSDKPINNDSVYTDQDLRIISRTCLDGILSNVADCNKNDILKFIPKINSGLYCLTNKSEVEDYFNNKLKCNFCKYYSFCKSKCFIQSIIKYKPEQCQIKEIFKAFDND